MRIKFFLNKQNAIITLLMLFFWVDVAATEPRGVLVRSKNRTQAGDINEMVVELNALVNMDSVRRVHLDSLDIDLFYFDGTANSDSINAILESYDDLFEYVMENEKLSINPKIIVVPGEGGGKGQLEQWYLQNINAEQAWMLMNGNDNKIKTALIGTGVKTNHPDFPTDCFTDDGCGFQNGYYTAGDISDDNGHETKVCGIITAMRNGEGIDGIATGNVDIMVIKAFDSEGYGYTGDAVWAIEYAVNQGAKIINLSWGNLQENNALKDAIRYAESKGVLIISAAGNSEDYQFKNAVMPAAYFFENIISVTASNQQGNLTETACYDIAKVDLAAPGINIMTTDTLNSYAQEDGTSMSVAIVTATAALIWAKEPDLTFEQVKMKILQGTVNMNTTGKSLTEGRLDIYKAMISN